MCYYTLISLIPPPKYSSCSSIFWGMWTCLEVVPRSSLFLWTLPSRVHGSAAWQHSTVKDLTHKAGEEARDKSLYLEFHAERDWKQVQDLGNPEVGSQGQGTDTRGHMWEALSSCPFCTGQKESTGLIVFVVVKSIFFFFLYCWYFGMFPVLKTWTEKGGTTIRKRPVGICRWVG